LEGKGGAYLDECAVAKHHVLADDITLGKRFWEESEKITGTSFLSSK